MRPILLAVFALSCSGSGSNDPPPPDTTIPATFKLALETVASGLQSPVYLTAPANDSRLFIVEQPGRVRIVQSGQLLQQPFLDIVSKVASGGERGLLSIAFHPSYATNGFFFVSYTDLAGDTKVERYTVSSSANVAEPASAKLILFHDQPFANHNGGHIAFGPDGLLYIARGDGGSGGDPHNNGQNTNTLLGKLLRIDVNAGDPYSIPVGNPFRGQSGKRGEIWAYGLRNPWRIAFDRGSDRLYIADAGQDKTEEINVVSRTDAGLNFGWRIMEGDACFNPNPCSQSGLTLPLYTYPTASPNCAVTGGYVYRGSAMSEILGHYFFSDYCGGGLRSFRVVNGVIQGFRDWGVAGTGNVSSFGEDAAGNIYVISHAGTVSRIVRAP